MTRTLAAPDSLPHLLTFTLPLALALGACAEAPFSVHAEDNDKKALQGVLARLKPEAPAPRNGSGHAMAYVFAAPEKSAKDGSSKGERTLYGFDLVDGQQRFAVAADVRSRPVVARGVLAEREGDELVLRNPQSGAVRAKVALGEGRPLLLGVAADEQRVYYVTRDGEAPGAKTDEVRSPRESHVTAVSHDGQRQWSVTAPGSLGAPAVHSGLLVVPFRYQNLVVLDGQTGTELTRVRQKDEQIGFVRQSEDGFSYGVGDRGAALLTERSVNGLKDQEAYFTPKLGDKVRVFLHWDGYRPEQADFSAFDRNRLLWSTERRGDGVGLRDDQAVLHSYRFLFAVDTAGGPVRWAYAQPRHNIMSSDETGAAVLYAAQDGELGALDRKSGARLSRYKLALAAEQQVVGATFDAAGYTGTAAAAEGKTPEAQAATNRGADALAIDALTGIIFDKDSSFIAVKTFAVQQLDTLKSKQATAALLKVVTAEAMPLPVARAAGDALIGRKDREVASMLVQALSERQDFLTDRRPRGIGILAKAAAAMGAKEALPALVTQLRDPTHTPAVQKELVSALVQLGGADAVRPLREFLLLYRSDPSFTAAADPLKAAGEGLLKAGGEPGRRTVYFVAEEPRTLPTLASFYRKLLDDTAQRASAPQVPGSKTP